MYCRVAQLIGNRKELSEESLESLEEVVMDGAKAQAILDASRSSMGEKTTIWSRLYCTKIRDMQFQGTCLKKLLKEHLKGIDLCPFFAHPGLIIVLGA